MSSSRNKSSTLFRTLRGLPWKWSNIRVFHTWVCLFSFLNWWLGRIRNGLTYLRTHDHELHGGRLSWNWGLIRCSVLSRASSSFLTWRSTTTTGMPTLAPLPPSYPQLKWFTNPFIVKSLLWAMFSMSYSDSNKSYFTHLMWTSFFHSHNFQTLIN